VAPSLACRREQQAGNTARQNAKKKARQRGSYPPQLPGLQTSVKGQLDTYVMRMSLLNGYSHE
jgi:hypothetical protein